MNNCLFFALKQWMTRGGYLAIRKSKHGPWLHFVWISDLKDAEIEHYVPLKVPLKNPWITKIFFKGKVSTRK